MAQLIERGKDKNGNYRFYFRASNGYNKQTGKQNKEGLPWTAPPGLSKFQAKKEAEYALCEFEKSIQSGMAISAANTFKEFAEEWMINHSKHNLKAKTKHEYEKLLVRINAAIGDQRLDKVTPIQLDKFYNNLKEEGIRLDIKFRANEEYFKIYYNSNLNATKLAKNIGLGNSTIQSVVNGNNISYKSAQKIAKYFNRKILEIFVISNGRKVLSNNTVLHYHRLISSIYSYAIRKMIIRNNPAEYATVPRIESSKARFLDELQVDVVLKHLKRESHQFELIIKMFLDCGMRLGENCGLKWSDIDFINGSLTISRELMYIPGIGVFEESTKTRKSRDIKLARSIIQALHEHKIKQYQNSEKFGDQWKEQDYIFTNWNGDPIRPDTLSSMIHNFVKKYNLPYFTAHILRHTNASLLMANGLDIATISHRLGHASIETTLRVYAHAMPSKNGVAAVEMEKIFIKSQNVEQEKNNDQRLRKSALRNLRSQNTDKLGIRHKQDTKASA